MRFGYCEAADDADWCKIARLDSFCERSEPIACHYADAPRDYAPRTRSIVARGCRLGKAGRPWLVAEYSILPARAPFRAVWALLAARQNSRA